MTLDPNRMNGREAALALAVLTLVAAAGPLFVGLLLVTQRLLKG